MEFLRDLFNFNFEETNPNCPYSDVDNQGNTIDGITYELINSEDYVTMNGRCYNTQTIIDILRTQGWDAKDPFRPDLLVREHLNGNISDELRNVLNSVEEENELTLDEELRIFVAEETQRLNIQIEQLRLERESIRRDRENLLDIVRERLQIAIENGNIEDERKCLEIINRINIALEQNDIELQNHTEIVQHNRRREPFTNSEQIDNNVTENPQELRDRTIERNQRQEIARHRIMINRRPHIPIIPDSFETEVPQNTSTVIRIPNRRQEEDRELEENSRETRDRN